MHTTDYRFTQPAIWLHWLIAALIVVQFVLAELAEDAGSQLQELALLANHKSVGLTILALALARIGWRVTHKPPALPEMARWQTLASRVSHFLLYGLLLLLPMSGWLLSSASAYSVSWFGLFSLPDLVAPAPTLKETLEWVHEFLGTTLFAVALIHLAAALKHAFIDKDNVLRGMTSLPALAASGALLIGALWWLGDPIAASAAPDEGTAASGADNVDQSAAGVSTADVSQTVAQPITLSDAALPVWQIDQSSSFVRFTATQAGAEFSGRFDIWSADIQFAEDNLEASQAVVKIDLTSVHTRDTERDTTLQSQDWFATTSTPEAVFTAARITAQDTHYRADAVLAIKGAVHPVEFVFSITRRSDADGRHLLKGHAKLDRVKLGIGTGEWTDTTWVGANVDVEVQVVTQ